MNTGLESQDLSLHWCRERPSGLSRARVPEGHMPCERWGTAATRSSSGSVVPTPFRCRPSPYFHNDQGPGVNSCHRSLYFDPAPHTAAPTPSVAQALHVARWAGGLRVAVFLGPSRKAVGCIVIF